MIVLQYNFNWHCVSQKNSFQEFLLITRMKTRLCVTYWNELLLTLEQRQWKIPASNNVKARLIGFFDHQVITSTLLTDKMLTRNTTSVLCCLWDAKWQGLGIWQIHHINAPAHASQLNCNFLAKTVLNNFSSLHTLQKWLPVTLTFQVQNTTQRKIWKNVFLKCFQ